MKIFAGFSLGMVIGGAVTWVATQEVESSISEREALPVATQVLREVNFVERDRSLSGTVMAARKARLAFPRIARLKTVFVDEGDSVNSKENLALLDTRQLEDQIEQVTAELARQQAVLQELHKGPRDETIAAARADLAAMNADVSLRQATFRRVEKLYRKDAASEQSHDEARDALAASKARRDAGQARLDELTAGTRQEQKDAQAAVVKSLQHQLESLNVDLHDSTLKAPFAGTIVSRLVDEGEMLSPQQPVLELIETGQLEAHVGVPSSLLDSFLAYADDRMQESGYLTVRSGEHEVHATLRKVLPQIDPSTRTQTVILTIEDSDDHLVVDGQLIKLDFVESVSVVGAFFEVPQSSLVSGASGLWAVYVVEPLKDREGEGIVTLRDVARHQKTGESVVVKALHGAFNGEVLIVSDGVHKVVPGQLVSFHRDEKEWTE